ncbi:MAG: tripartite tricarboxylate transporter substrate binding protein [Comamonadaceae bacterium]|nr:MAG: tripartite tricarboxylate transporter substrate binding protein [Comamonadaceae bacterium]
MSRNAGLVIFDQISNQRDIGPAGLDMGCRGFISLSLQTKAAMKALSRRTAAAALFCAVALPFSPLAAAWPDKPITMIVPYPPGGTSDYVARIVANKLGEVLGQTVIVDNRPGAGAIVGTAAAALAPADGYTILLTAPEFTLNPAVRARVPYDARKDFAPVALIASYPHVLVVNPQVPAKDVRQLIALAKAKPGEMNFASGGSGGSNHASGEFFKHTAGVQITHIPYKGNGPALTDLVTNRVQMLFTGLAPVETQVKSGQLRAIAVTGPTRLAAAPDVPTMAESGLPGYNFSTWYGVLVPADTPKAVIERLNAGLRKTMDAPEVKDKLSSLGADLTVSTPQAYGTMLQEEVARWSTLVKATGMTAE